MRTPSRNRALCACQTSAMLCFLSSCKAINPAFESNQLRDQDPASPATSSSEATNDSTPTNSSDPSAQSSVSSRPELTLSQSIREPSAPSLTTTPSSTLSTSNQSSSSTTTSTTSTNGNTQDPSLAQLCPSSASLCYPMLERQNPSQAVEERQGTLPLTFQNDLALENPGAAPSPWDHIAKINSYSAVAFSRSEFRVANEDQLGLEVWAENLQCQNEGFCTVAAIDGRLSVEYNNDGRLRCRVNDSIRVADTTITAAAPKPRLRISCWFHGNQLFVRGTAAAIFLQVDAKLSLEPTRISIAGTRPKTGTNTMQGSISLLRVWTSVQEFENRMSTHIYAKTPSP